MLFVSSHTNYNVEELLEKPTDWIATVSDGIIKTFYDIGDKDKNKKALTTPKRLKSLGIGYKVDTKGKK